MSNGQFWWRVAVPVTLSWASLFLLSFVGPLVDHFFDGSKLQGTLCHRLKVRAMFALLMQPVLFAAHWLGLRAFRSS